MRRKTWEVMVGNIGVGGENPVRIQSMTTTDTMDTLATVEESIRMIEKGCEIVRITAPGVREAENLAKIKAMLKERGYEVPLVADIHFTPKAAEIAATIVEKVRVNPGNYNDKKKFQYKEYTEDQYNRELQKIEKRFSPLVDICKTHDTAMRIGTNHGSLSDRILSKYGDTPEGMVESAMEFLRICVAKDYKQVVLSMKASNTLVMVQAYRLLVKTMEEEGMYFPLHLGVTEAGDGMDGRVKSAVGIGTLLQEGLGDTLRVSLTEPPEDEIPVCQAILKTCTIPETLISHETYGVTPYEISKRQTVSVGKIGSEHLPIVCCDWRSLEEEISPQTMQLLHMKYSQTLDKWSMGDRAPDSLVVNAIPAFAMTGNLQFVLPSSETEWSIQSSQSTEEQFILWNLENPLCVPEHTPQSIFLCAPDPKQPLYSLKQALALLHSEENKQPVVLYLEQPKDTNSLETMCSWAGWVGALLVDGILNGICYKPKSLQDSTWCNNLAFNILQACRARTSQTEYISCPSCGRTLFDLQETTAKVRKATEHLKGLKIGIMGCIVNGPGEMADADYGYVGTGIGNISLYKGQEVMKRNIPSEIAVEELIALIAENGDWKDKETS